MLNIQDGVFWNWNSPVTSEKSLANLTPCADPNTDNFSEVTHDDRNKDFDGVIGTVSIQRVDANRALQNLQHDWRTMNEKVSRNLEEGPELDQGLLHLQEVVPDVAQSLQFPTNIKRDATRWSTDLKKSNVLTAELESVEKISTCQKKACGRFKATPCWGSQRSGRVLSIECG